MFYNKLFKPGSFQSIVENLASQYLGLVQYNQIHKLHKNKQQWKPLFFQPLTTDWFP